MPSFINVTSKTFWLGAAMALGGAIELAGIPGLSIAVQAIWPQMDAATLLSSGLALIFVKDAIQKTAAAK